MISNYDREFRRYGFGYFPGDVSPLGGYGIGRFAGMPGGIAYGLGFNPYGVPAPGFGGYDYDFEHRRPPRQSPTYGRRGDQAVQRWARNHGYDAGYTIQPRQGQGRPPPQGSARSGGSRDVRQSGGRGGPRYRPFR